MVNFLLLMLQISLSFHVFARVDQNDIEEAQQDVLVHVIGRETNEFENTGAEVICQHDRMCISVSQRFYHDNGIKNPNLDALSLHEECNHTVISDPNPDSRTLCTPDGGIIACGTEMMLNDTHVTYKNALSTYNIQDEAHPNVVIHQNTNLAIPWECSYPLEYLVTLSNKNLDPLYHSIPTPSDIREVELPIDAYGVGFGSFPVGMFFYKSQNFLMVRTSLPIFQMTDKLFVGVSLMQGPEDAFIEIRRCWATPSAFPDDPTNFVLIKGYCPDLEAVKFHGMGNTVRQTWSSPVFKFPESSFVYIHCAVTICFNKKPNICNKRDFCSMITTTRRRRSASGQSPSQVTTVLTVGPISLGDDVTSVVRNNSQVFADDNTRENSPVEPPESSNKWKLYFIFAVVFMMIMVAGAILLICAIKMRNFYR